MLDYVPAVQLHEMLARLYKVVGAGRRGREVACRAFGGLGNPSASQQPLGDNSLETVYHAEVKDILRDYDERKERRQALVGTVVSNKNRKSVSVQVLREKFFPKYNKVMSARKKIMAHDEEEVGKVGDVVRIVPCRPMSKMKRHRVIDILKRGEV